MTRTNSITTRLLSPSDDFAEVYGVIRRAYGEVLEKYGVGYTATRQNMDEVKARTDKGDCFVALYDGEIAGVIVLYRREESSRWRNWYAEPGVGACGLFAVDPPLQGKGVGKALLQAAETRARELGMKEMALDTAEPVPYAVPYYQSRGFRFVEIVQWEGNAYRNVMLSKTLN